MRSLAFRTDLALLEASGSTVADRGEYVVVRTRDNPAYRWGNFLLLPQPPTPDEAIDWLAVFESELPEAEHRAFGVDLVDGTRADLTGFAAAGLSVLAATVMTATAVHEPPRPDPTALYRPLHSDDDWAQQVELAVAGEPEWYTREFATTKTAAVRGLTDTGLGAWWGAFLDDRLVASMGLFTAGTGLARFQEVKTHPDARGRGLAGTLVHKVSEYGFGELGARTLVMVADPDYLAIRVYRSVGFAGTETQLQAERRPD